MKKNSFKVFNRMMKIKNVKFEKKVNLFNRIIKFIRFKMKIAFWKLFKLFAISVILIIYGGIAERKRMDSNYRKVIKKGILWDSVEYHER